MNKHKNINEIMKSWGGKNQKVPPDNIILKNKILSKVPSGNFDASLYLTREKFSLPWPSFAFATLAILVFIGSSFFTQKGIFTGSVVENMAVTDESYYAPQSSNKSVQQPIRPYEYDLPITDTREFLKTSYNASIRALDVESLRFKVELAVRGFGGRIDASSGDEKRSYISFAVPADKFEMFRQEIKSMSWAKLFTENINSKNLLPQKQSIEGRQKKAEDAMAGIKSERAQLIRSHTEAETSRELADDALDRESGLLQVEWQTAGNDRRLQITSRLTQIQTEKNIIQFQTAEDNKIYQNKLTTLNNKLKNAEAEAQSAKTQDKNLMEDISTVNGYIYLNHINLWELADIYIPGPLLAWIFIAVAMVLYWRHRVYMG